MRGNKKRRTATGPPYRLSRNAKKAIEDILKAFEIHKELCDQLVVVEKHIRRFGGDPHHYL